MRVLLVCRGSQGDVFPYLAVAGALVSQNHEVTISVPQVFEKDVKNFGVSYVLQGTDDILGMIETANNTRDLIAWTKRIIHDQFEEIIPLLKRHDILVASNTEFAAPSIAEYCQKPCIRTAYAPLLPGKRLAPPVFPSNPFPPALQWNMLNVGLNLMVKKTLNEHRKALGMSLIKDQSDHAPKNSENYLMHSKFLGEVDPDWKYKWEIGGYCFNDLIPYNEVGYRKLTDFMHKDGRPVLFFTLGSCTSKKGNEICVWLCDLAEKHNFKLIIGAGWFKMGSHLQDKPNTLNNIFILSTPIPHYLIFPSCAAIIHHGGSGTTHSAGRSGRPQMAAPLIIDQHYWGSRIHKLGVGPAYLKIPSITKSKLERKVLDLMTNPLYKKNALELEKQIRSENGIQAMCDYITKF